MSCACMLLPRSTRGQQQRQTVQENGAGRIGNVLTEWIMSKNDTKFYIDGEWVEPAEPHLFDVINPATEEVAGQISAVDTLLPDICASAAAHCGGLR